jgi:hypothetical protein
MNFFKIFIVISVWLFISCNSNMVYKPKSYLAFNIQNNQVKFGDTLIIEVHNLSTIDYFLPIDFLNRGSNRYLYTSSLNYFPRFITKGIIYKNVLRIIGIENRQDNYYFKSIDSFFLIKSKETKILKIPFAREYNLLDGEIVTYDLNKKGIYNLNLVYTINSEDVLKYLKKDSIQQLNELGYICYDGKITSNTIKLIIE